MTRLLLQMGRGSSTPSRELVNHVLGERERIDDKVEVLSLPAQTLLHRSVSLGQNAVAMWLVMKGADINAFDGNGRTPLDHAITGEKKELADYLRSKGAFSAADRFVDNLDGAVTDMVNHPPLATINASQTVDQAAPANKDENKRFIDNRDGSVTDTHTDLIWMRCALGQTWDGVTCTGTAPGYSWKGAIATHATFAGHSDWRTPDIGELLSIVDPTRSDPAIDITVFPNTPNQIFWSATPANSGCAHYVSFSSGRTFESGRTNSNCVRLVRGGSTKVSSYIDNNNGTVADPLTDLTWMRCAVGQTWDGASCMGAPNVLTWHAAMALHQNFAGHADWRLPDLAELQSIVESSSGTSALDPSVFNKLPRVFFWTSSLRLDGAIGITFGNGLQGFCSKDADGAVLLMRDEKQAQNSMKRNSYLDNGDGTITDIRTDLIWMRCALGQRWDGKTCIGKANSYTWGEAIVLDQEHTERNNWRLPSLDELKSILDFSRTAPAIDTTAFPETPSAYFWTSTTSSHSMAWGVDFNLRGSTTGSHKFNNHVRLVSGGKPTEKTLTTEFNETLKQPMPAKINPDSIKTSIKTPAVANNSNSYLPEKIAVHSPIDEILKRLDLFEARFNEAIDRIEISLDPIPAGQSEILNAIWQLQPPSCGNTNKTTDDISGLRLLIERQEIRFNSSINSIEMLLKSLFQTQVAALAAMTPVQQTSAANTEILASEIAELRQMIVTALQSAPPTSQTIPPPTTDSEPKVSDLDSKAIFSAWLVEQDVISLSDLRIRLLPLDLLPNAVINDINERALDLIGEPALIEEGDTVIVQREVLLQVIAG
ncbi:DUF1566 domain-containing protein [Sulfuriferula sp.]|uniref:Lcl C-terminal domain-containing protein n=1 Tax=Sulfuriferula sp. TaxID=2025307 RepID=UPI00272F318B|nr:DUF1566 domain-containing protein [Sulfuriferula sp.]MDP2024647.1 DUF1566 domain-containing protein [Sulfuriferula sp.]